MIWHSQQEDAVLNEFSVTREDGLSADRVEEAQKTYGKNVLRERPPRSFFMRFVDQLKSAMILILILAAAVSAGISAYQWFRGEPADWIDPIAIVLIVLINALIGVIQESRAEAALAALKSLSAPSAKVQRDGVRQVVDASELVPGDIVFLEAGDLIPADCRLLHTAMFRCDESMLTGECVAADKDAHVTHPDIAPIGDRSNMAYSGCIVSNGTATAVVVDTGMNTEIGKIAVMLESEKKSITPLQHKLEELGKKLGVLALVICGIIFVIGLFDHIKFLEIFMTSVSLAVAAIPEGLPAVVTVVLALGVQRMADKNAIVRRLPAVETLGCASVICTDKTGTLTQNKMTLTRMYVDGKALYLDDLPSKAVTTLLQMAALCTDGNVTMVDGREIAVGDPTETAILSYALKQKLDKNTLMNEYPRVGEIPFDSDRKLMTSVHIVDGKKLVVVKGAPDVLLSRCVDVDEEEVLNVNRRFGKEALRVLAVGYKFVDDLPVHLDPNEVENGLTFGGLLGMIDPPRPEAVAAIKACKNAGIRTVMITGDHVVTATAIGKALGILKSESEAMTGEQLAAMSDDELFENVRKISVYARVSPTDKIRIVKAWQKAGEIVSMTGDGVNDAPALSAADIGCAMGITGTDVAKNAADVVLTDDNFATIVTAVERGRGIYNNIKKSVQFLLSCNLGEILCVFFAMLFWKESPLLPVQLLWVNLITDSLPALALGMEPTDTSIMTKKPRPKTESIFAHGLAWNSLWQGAMIAVLTLVAFSMGLKTGPELACTMAFAVLAFSQLIHALNTRSNLSLFRVHLHTNPSMLLALLVSGGLMAASLLIPPLQTVFGVVPMSGDDWLIVGILSVIPFVVMELFKAATVLLESLLYKSAKRKTDWYMENCTGSHLVSQDDDEEGDA